ncbi:MAG: cobyric acid synthase [Desulfuromonadales bacterium]|nr:cobyric acid synthase [Desulfuromonadales bacterium]
MAKLYIVGSGPGDISHLTEAARRAIAASTVIVGYNNYIDLIRPLVEGKRIIATAMMQEVERCREAIRLAREGETVALVSGGDAGIYGMAGLIYELIEIDSRQNGPNNEPLPLEVSVIPGISAIQAAASVLGAPLMHDFAVISLSDLLTPWDLIKTRLEAAARADFVIVIFNPRSKSRVTQIEEARRIILAARPAETPAGIVRNACRAGESVTVTSLGTMLDHDIDMSTIVIIGNSSTFVDSRGRMVTPRGYVGKYCTPAGEPDETTVSAEPLPRAGAVMFCGTASDVGKSVITSGVCRLLLKRGISVAPFKSQNMSLNSFVTPEGGEIGRAQAVQAQACDINPHTDMNPILLKPNSDTGSQVIVQGRPVGNMNVQQYDAYKPTVMPAVRACFERLRQSYEFIVIEGAGSISEINLRHADIANLKIALMARCPVILVADIDRGGVFAQIVGTIELLEPLERAYIKGIIINKFRGDASILTPGLDFIRERTGIPVLGVLPWMSDLALPAEDSVALCNRSRVVSLIAGQKRIHIGVLRLPRISNFTDFDALESEADVILSYVEMPEQIRGLDVLIIPGSKSTIADLYFLMERGIYNEIKAFRGHIIGICGGYQMLGARVLDPHGVESFVKEAVGLGFLPVETEMLPEKETHQALAQLEEAGLSVAPDCGGVINGYEIHMGQTTHFGTPRPFARIFRRGEACVTIEDGSVSQDNRIFGTYLHGIFDNAPFRDAYLNRIRLGKGMTPRRRDHTIPLNDPFDQLAEHLEQHLDVTQLLNICGLG